MLFLSVIAYPLVADEFELSSPDGNSLIRMDIGEKEAFIYRDTEASHVVAEELEHVVKDVKKGDSLRIRMASGGGYAAHIKKLD